MERNEFLRLTSKIFQEFGFIKIGNQFFLNIDRVVIRVYRFGARFNPGAYCYSYNVCFKDIHEGYQFETNDDYKNMPEDLGVLKDICTCEIRKNCNRRIINPKDFFPSDYNQDEWKTLWNEALHREFDPFIYEFESYVKKRLKPEDLGMCIASYKEFLKRGIIFTYER